MPTMRMEVLQHQAHSSCLQLLFKQQKVQLEACRLGGALLNLTLKFQNAPGAKRPLIA